MFRYEYLPTLYTLMYESNHNGASVVRPPSHVYPKDRRTHDLPFQFFWSDLMMFCPVVYEGATEVEAYFPPETQRWYDAQTGLETGFSGDVVLETELDQFNAHIPGGKALFTHIIPEPEAWTTESLSTEDLREVPFGMVFTLDENYQAEGTLYVDSWDSLNPIEDGEYAYMKVTLGDAKMRAERIHGDWTRPINVQHIRIYGADRLPVEYIKCNGEKVDFEHDMETGIVTIDVDFDLQNFECDASFEAEQSPIQVIGEFLNSLFNGWFY